MSKKVENTDTPVVYVKLGDAGSIFFDISTDTKIVGSAIHRVENTVRIEAAIKGNALVKCTEADWDKQEAPAIDAQSEKTAEQEEAEKATAAAQKDADDKALAEKEEAEKAAANATPAPTPPATANTQAPAPAVKK